MRSIISSSVTCPSVTYFNTVSHKEHDFRKNVTEYKKSVLNFFTTFVQNISLPKENSGRYYKCA